MQAKKVEKKMKERIAQVKKKGQSLVAEEKERTLSNNPKTIKEKIAACMTFNKELEEVMKMAMSYGKDSRTAIRSIAKNREELGEIARELELALKAKMMKEKGETKAEYNRQIQKAMSGQYSESFLGLGQVIKTYDTMQKEIRGSKNAKPISDLMSGRLRAWDELAKICSKTAYQAIPGKSPEKATFSLNSKATGTKAAQMMDMKNYQGLPVVTKPINKDMRQIKQQKPDYDLLPPEAGNKVKSEYRPLIKQANGQMRNNRMEEKLPYGKILKNRQQQTSTPSSSAKQQQNKATNNYSQLPNGKANGRGNVQSRPYETMPRNPNGKANKTYTAMPTKASFFQGNKKSKSSPSSSPTTIRGPKKS